VHVVTGVIGAFFLFMTLTMTSALVHRTRKIVVGERGLTTPRNILWRSPIVEIPYADMREVSLTEGAKGGLRIRHGDQMVEILRKVLGSDAEFDEMAILIKQRVRAAAESAAHAP